MASCPSNARAALALAGILAAALAGAPAEAQSPLTLADARRTALERNTDFRIAESNVDAAIAQLRTAREFPNPTLSLSTAKISTDGTPEGTAMGNSLANRSYDSIAALSQLFLLGKRGLMRDAARQGVDSARFQRDDARRLILEGVTQAYAAALAALRQAEVLTDSAAKLRREADIAGERLKVGDISESDKAQLEIAADEDELGADSQRAQAQAAVIALEILLGSATPTGATPLADTLEGWAARIPADLEDAPVGARPDIAAAQADLSQADTNIRLAERQRVPDVTASVQYERNPPDQPNTVGIGLSLPLPVWDHFGGEILSAKAAREQAEARLDKVRIQAAADVASARVAYHEASRRAHRYRASLVPNSEEVTKSVSYAFEKGGAALIDLLEAERNDNAIRVASVQADSDWATTAAALETALGRGDATP